MKTSSKLLILLSVVTLTGMISINSLLKTEYDKINWNNPYQEFQRHSLPALRHIRIVGTPEYEVLIRPGAKPQALITPYLKSSILQTTQRGDTLLVRFNTKGTGWQESMNYSWYDGPVGLVLQLPQLASLNADNIRVNVSGFETPQLTLAATHSRLSTEKIRVPGALTVQIENRTAAFLRADTCGTLYAQARDSTDLDLVSIRPNRLIPEIAPKAKLQIRGQQLKTLQ